MTRLSLRRDPVRLIFSPVPWAAAWYLFSYLFIGWVLFAVALIIVVGGGLLSLTLIGIPVLTAAAAAIRGLADFERARLRVVDAEPIERAYRGLAGESGDSGESGAGGAGGAGGDGDGLLARLRSRWTDPAIWRDISYLFGLLVPLWALDLAVLAVWLDCFAGITVPFWYGHDASAVGRYANSLPSALILAAISLVAFLLFTYVVVAVARLHAAVARRLLGPPEDPLRAAKEVLSRPGPLTPFIPNERW